MLLGAPYVVALLVAVVVAVDARKMGLSAAGWGFGSFMLPLIVPIAYAVVRSGRAKQLREEAERARRYELEAAARRHEMAVAQRRQQEQQLVQLGEQALAAFEAAPRHLASAQQNLDAAEADMKQRAFSPFWESIERALSDLGAFDGCLRTIVDCAERHRGLASSLGRTDAVFPVERSSAASLDVSRAVSERLNALVRAAQTDFQFAMIYEQRRTSSILIAGFRSLGDAIWGMSQYIADSVDRVRRSLEDHSTAALRESSASSTRLLERQDATVRALGEIKNKLE